jgi:hypothetical protein
MHDGMIGRDGELRFNMINKNMALTHFLWLLSIFYPNTLRGLHAAFTLVEKSAGSRSLGRSLERTLWSLGKTKHWKTFSLAFTRTVFEYGFPGYTKS